MDRYDPLQLFNLNSFVFQATRYEEYQGGRLIDSGNTLILVNCQVGENIKCLIGNNNLHEKLMSCTFDQCMTLNDRLLMITCPAATNVSVPIISVLRMTLGYTRESKLFNSNEPIVGSIYTENGNVVKMSFTMGNPERLIELFL